MSETHWTPIGFTRAYTPDLRGEVGVTPHPSGYVRWRVYSLAGEAATGSRGTGASHLFRGCSLTVEDARRECDEAAASVLGRVCPEPTQT